MKVYIASLVAALGLSSLSSAITGEPCSSSQFDSKFTHIVSYDNGYDDASRSMTVVSCSDGANGLITRYGWQTQGQIPHFAYIGGYQGIAGWNSPEVWNEHSCVGTEFSDPPISAVPATPLPTRAKRSMFSPLTMRDPDSILLKQPWMILQMGMRCSMGVSTRNMRRSMLAAAELRKVGGTALARRKDDVTTTTKVAESYCN